MIAPPATREQLGEIVLSAREEIDIELRARELAGEAIDNGWADAWIGAAACGEHSALDAAAVLDVVCAAISWWASPTMPGRMDRLEDAIDRLRGRYVAACAEDYYAQAWQEYNERSEEE